MTAPLRILDDICGSTRCLLDWDDLVGGDRTRHCESCCRSVLNLSALTKAEAERAFADPNVGCVRLIREADGTPVFEPEPVAKAAGKIPLRRPLLVCLWTGLLVVFGARFAERADASPSPRVNIDRKKLERDARMAELQKNKPFPQPRRVIYMGKF